jgi:nicotinamidase/pyrazinamidase
MTARVRWGRPTTSGDRRPPVPMYDPHTALLIVDLQNDFADPKGSLYVKGGDEVVAFADAERSRALSAGANVIFTQDWHPPHTPHFARDGGIWPVHCVQGTWGAAFRPGVTIDGVVLRKGIDGRDGYSGFSVRDPTSGATEATELERLLREAAVDRLVVTGLATDYCVVETVCDARMLGFDVDVLGAGIRAVDLHDGDGGRAILRMRDAGAEIV